MKKSLLLGLGAVAMAFTAGAGISASANVFFKATETTAATTEAKTIYVDLDKNTKFNAGDANPWVRYYNGSHNYVQLISDGNNIFHTETAIPAEVFTNSGYGFEIYCYNQAQKGNDCTSVWQSGDSSHMLYYENYNYICLDGYVAKNQATILGYGSYGSEIVNPGSTAPATQRVWLKNDTPNFYDNDDWGTGCKNVIGYTSGGAWTTIEMVGVLNTYNSNYYFYADIPSTVTQVHFMRMARATNHKYIVYLDGYVSTLQYGVCYYSGTANYGDFVNLSTGSVNNADNNLLGAVLEGFVVCESSAPNGANETTVENLYSTWFENKTGDGTAEIDDYKTGEYTKHGNSYDGAEKGTDNWTINEKWNALCENAGVDPLTGIAASKKIASLQGIENNTPVLVSVLSASIALASIGGFFFLRRRKED